MFEKEGKKYSSQNCKIKDISQTTLKFCYTALFSLLLYPSFWLKQWWNQYLHVSRNQGDPSPLLRDFWEEKAFTLAWLVSFWSLRWAGWASQGRHVRSCFPFTKELKLPKCFPSIKNQSAVTLEKPCLQSMMWVNQELLKPYTFSTWTSCSIPSRMFVIFPIGQAYTSWSASANIISPVLIGPPHGLRAQEGFGCVCAASETVSFSIVSRRRQTCSQTVLSLSLWNKSLFVFQGKPLFCFFPLSQSKQSLHSPVPTYSSGLLKPDAQRNGDGFLCRQRLKAQSTCCWPDPLKPRHAVYRVWCYFSCIKILSLLLLIFWTRYKFSTVYYTF